MSSPTQNSVPTQQLDTDNLDTFGALIFGTKWGAGGWGTGAALTYSFPVGTAYFVTPYGEGKPTEAGEFSAWYPLSESEQAAAIAGLTAWSNLANVTFAEAPDNESMVGELRFAFTDIVDPQEAAHTYLPADNPEAGDVWFASQEWHTDKSASLAPGTYDYLTIIHEIGHALGLKHPFSGSDKLPQQYDHYAYTVMSYSARPGSDNNDASFYPTTPMYFDIEAIQALYGRQAHNAGDTVYTYVGGQNYWETIDDSGGVDTIAYQGADDARIDLRIGRWSDLGLSITFDKGGPERDTVNIGPNTWIENAAGGLGDDKITGNGLVNAIAGGDGDDRLKGRSGGDTLSGGPGKDQLSGGKRSDLLDGGDGKDRLSGGRGDDAFVFAAGLGGGNVDKLKSFSHGHDVLALDLTIFGALTSDGLLGKEAFHKGAKAADADDRIVYNKAKGALYYDADGQGGEGQVRFATLPDDTKVGHNDFLVIA